MPETNQVKAYYRFREEFNTSKDPFRRAVLLLYLNRFGYNGLCHCNLCDELNVPFGHYKKPYFSEAELCHFAEKAQNAEFHCLPYEECMNRADDNSVVYCNPSYVPPSAMADFIAYHTNNFSPKEQAYLVETVEELASKQISVLILNHNTSDAHKWYRVAKHFQIKMRHSISNNDGTHEKVNELLALYKPGVVTPVKK